MSPVEREKEVLKGEAKEASKEELVEEINSLKQELSELKQIIKSFSQNPSNPDTIQTNHAENQTNTPSLAPSLPLFSTGNEGVQTNRQTDMPEMLEAVGHLKADLKQRFRSLTKQEFRVFSAIYLLEEQGRVDYPILASKLNLSETAIRDYVMKISRKGIPLMKNKINNKKVFLSLRQELKQLASLDALVKIREPVFR